jgi:amino acid transporter
MEATNQKMGLALTVILGMNAMIGASIFTAPSKLMVSVGPAGLLTYCGVIFAVLMIGLSFAYLATWFPEEGSFYVYASKWGGHYVGLATAFIYLIGLSIAMGLVAFVTGTYLHIWFSHIDPKILGSLVVVLLAALNLLGAKANKIGQLILIVLTLLPMAIIALISLSTADFSRLSPFMPHGLLPVLTASQAVVFGFLGFEAIPSLFPLVRDPKNTIPKAVTISIILVGLIYMAFVGLIMLGIPSHHFADINTPLTSILLNHFPEYPWLISLIQGAIVITLMGTLHAMIWSLSTLFQSTLRYVRRTKITISSGTSVLLISSFIIGVCLLARDLDLLFNLTALGVVCAYAMVIPPLFMKPRRTVQTVIIGTLALGCSLVICGFALYGILS